MTDPRQIKILQQFHNCRTKLLYDLFNQSTANRKLWILNLLYAIHFTGPLDLLSSEEYIYMYVCFSAEY